MLNKEWKKTENIYKANDEESSIRLNIIMEHRDCKKKKKNEQNELVLLFRNIRVTIKTMRGVYIYTYYYIIKYSDEKTKKQTKKCSTYF